jgi:hypothetical protein
LDGHIPASLGNLQTLAILKISNNKLFGTIPKQLFGIQTLLNIELSFNNLDSPLHADIGNAKQLTYLDISSNRLSGEIPSDIGNCESLEEIKLGHNVFIGSIPTSLGNITNLQILNLSRNHLTGSIPMSLGSLKFLEQLDLSFNRLVGDVPTAGIFSNLSSVWIDGNTGLCGGEQGMHLHPCSAMNLNSKKNEHFTVQKVLIPLGSVASVAILVILGKMFLRGKQTKMNVSLPSLGSRFPKVTYLDLARSTQGFSSSRLIGRGRYSSVNLYTKEICFMTESWLLSKFSAWRQKEHKRASSQNVML